jgi:hypothetical protein
MTETAAAVGRRGFDEIRYLKETKTTADATQKFFFRSGDDRFILIISSNQSPLMLQRSVNGQRLAKAALRGPAADAIELPVAEGFDAEVSYALWRARQSFSSNRIFAKLQKMSVVPKVYRWLRDIAGQTCKIVGSAEMAAHAEHLAGVSALPDALRDLAARASEGLSSGEIPSVSIMQHGDLWIGNILKARSSTGFVVIDWPGAKLDGVPFFDLVKFCLSIGASSTTLRREIAAHSEIIGCFPEHVLSYVLCGLGRLHSELEHFPEARFLDLCNRKAQQIISAVERS